MYSVAYDIEHYDMFRKDSESFAPNDDDEVFEWIGNWQETPPKEVVYQDYGRWRPSEVHTFVVVTHIIPVLMQTLAFGTLGRTVDMRGIKSWTTQCARCRYPSDMVILYTTNIETTFRSNCVEWDFDRNWRGFLCTGYS